MSPMETGKEIKMGTKLNHKKLKIVFLNKAD